MTKKTGQNTVTVIALVSPHKPLLSRAGTVLAMGGAILVLSTFVESAVLALQALGVAVSSFALFLFFAAIRVRGWTNFELRLDAKEIELPARPLSRRETVKVPLDSIEMVSYAFTGSQGPRLELLVREAVHVLPFRWFPAGVDPSHLALRLHVRSQLARAHQEPEPPELAAIEATLLADKSFGAFVVERLGEPPEVVATIDSKEEEAATAETLKGQGAKLYDCSVTIRALREALEHGLAAPKLPPTKPAQSKDFARSEVRDPPSGENKE